MFSRQGGWKEIFADEKAILGWVRSYQVREGNFEPTVQTESKSDSRGFLAGLASFSRRASGFFKSSSGRTSSGTATIGVRGLSEEEIKQHVHLFERATGARNTSQLYAWRALTQALFSMNEFVYVE